MTENNVIVCVDPAFCEAQQKEGVWYMKKKCMICRCQLAVRLNSQSGAQPISIKSTTEHFDGGGLCCELASVWSFCSLATGWVHSHWPPSLPQAQTGKNCNEKGCNVTVKKKKKVVYSAPLQQIRLQDLEFLCKVTVLSNTCHRLPGP